MTEHEIALTVNGTDRKAEVEPRTLLVYVLRDTLDYTGPNVGCESSRCGACTVERNGRAVKSCTVFGVQADGTTVNTAAALGESDHLPLQEAFRAEHGTPSGYCPPGLLATSADLLSENPTRDADEIRRALEGTLCRCTEYQNIVEAVATAVKMNYYETPRESTLADLSAALDVPQSTLRYRLRRAEAWLTNTVVTGQQLNEPSPPQRAD